MQNPDEAKAHKRVLGSVVFVGPLSVAEKKFRENARIAFQREEYNLVFDACSNRRVWWLNFHEAVRVYLDCHKGILRTPKAYEDRVRELQALSHSAGFFARLQGGLNHKVITEEGRGQEEQRMKPLWEKELGMDVKIVTEDDYKET